MRENSCPSGGGLIQACAGRHRWFDHLNMHVGSEAVTKSQSIYVTHCTTCLFFNGKESHDVSVIQHPHELDFVLFDTDFTCSFSGGEYLGSTRVTAFLHTQQTQQTHTFGYFSHPSKWEKIRVPTIFWYWNSRTFQGLTRTLKLHFQGPILDRSLQHGQY